jgi:RimJ/RimL family protein N-acetyltransferase
VSDPHSGIRIQPITDDLLDACWQLRLRALREHPDAFGQPFEAAAALSPSEIRATQAGFWTGGDNQVFIAIDEFGTLAGMIGVIRQQKAKERHRMAIWGVYVAPEYRGMGLSNRLMHTAIDYARSLEGVLQLHLEVMSTNTPAVRSYERAGFVRHGRIPRSVILNGVPIDSDLMVLVFDDYPPLELATRSGNLNPEKTEGTTS